MRILATVLLTGAILLPACAPTDRAGACNPSSSSCGDTCLRAFECVTECGGPVTNCGCCECAAGSFDVTECP